MQTFSSCGKQGLLFLAVLRTLIAVASFVKEHGLSSADSGVVALEFCCCEAHLQDHVPCIGKSESET